MTIHGVHTPHYTTPSARPPRGCRFLTRLTFDADVTRASSGNVREVPAAVGGLPGHQQPPRGARDDDATLLLPHGGRRHLHPLQRQGERETEGDGRRRVGSKRWHAPGAQRPKPTCCGSASGMRTIVVTYPGRHIRQFPPQCYSGIIDSELWGGGGGGSTNRFGR